MRVNAIMLARELEKAIGSLDHAIDAIAPFVDIKHVETLRAEMSYLEDFTVEIREDDKAEK